MLVGFVLKYQEGAVAGQEVPGLLQAPQLQTVSLLQLDGETHQETQRTSETALTQQEVRHQGVVYICSIYMWMVGIVLLPKHMFKDASILYFFCCQKIPLRDRSQQ